MRLAKTFFGDKDLHFVGPSILICTRRNAAYCNRNRRRVATATVSDDNPLYKKEATKYQEIYDHCKQIGMEMQLTSW